MLTLSLVCGCPVAATAQQSDQPDVLYEYARNKIGLLYYCRNQGLIGQSTAESAINAIKLSLKRLAVSDKLVRRRGDRAEEMGEAGFWDADGRENLVGVAKLFRTSLAGLCKELAGEISRFQQFPVSSQIPVASQIQTAPKIAPTEARPEPAPPTIAAKPAAPATLPAEPSKRSVLKRSPIEVARCIFNRREKPCPR
jgi:hypothetical protein